MRTPIHRSLFMQMLLYFAITVSLITILLSYILYANFEKSTIASLNQAYQRNLSQVSFSSSYMNESARNLLWTIFSSTNTAVLMYQDTSNMEELVPEVRSLNNMVETYPFVQSIYIYNQKLDRFIASGANPISYGNQFYDDEVLRWIGQKQLPLPSVPLARMMPSPVSSAEPIKVYTYMLYDLKSENTGVSGAVIVNVKAEYLQNLIDSFGRDLNGADTGQTLVHTQDGQVMNQTMERSFLADVSQEAYFKQILSSEKEAGWFENVINGEKSLITYVTPAQFDWIFVQIQPYDSVLANVQQIRKVTVSVSGLILLASIIASFILSRRLYRPIGQLVSSAKRVTGAEHGKEGGQALADLHVVQEVLTQAYVANQGSLQTEKRIMLKRLITDQQMPEEMGRYIIDKYGFSIESKGAYRLLLVKVDRYAEFQTNYSEKDRQLLCYGMVNAANELFSVAYTTEAAELDDESICILLSLSAEEQPDEEGCIAEIVKELQIWCEQSLRLSLTVSIGSRYTDHSQVRQAYHESLLLSYYRLVYGYGSIIHSGKLDLKRRGMVYRMLPKDEQALREALIDGKTDEAMHIYDEFMTETARHSYEIIMSNVLYITYVVHNTLLVMEENSLDEYNLDLSHSIRKIHQAETLDEIREMFSQIFEIAAETVNTRKMSRSSVMLDSVIALIETGYKDSNLSLESIADEIGMSKDYISKMFRKAFNKSITDYLLDLRVSKVIELMEDPRLEFTDILDRVGIENKKYFYTLFKKKMGVSLRDYRLKHLPIEKNRNFP
jgi:two-component system response regulator YesN